MTTGGCDCGAVRYDISGDPGQVTLCHCGQCRRLSGYAWASVKINDTDFTMVQGTDAVVWHSSSDWAKRGFCGTCGANLFYRLTSGDHVAVSAGSLDQPTGLKIGRHIFTKDKADYHDILDEAPQIERY